MLGFAVFSVLIGCIVVPIVYISKWIYNFIVHWQPVVNRENESHSDPDQDTLLKSHGYYIGETIGQGTYADVKKAYSVNDKKDVAVKIVNKLEVNT